MKEQIIQVIGRILGVEVGKIKDDYMLVADMMADSLAITKIIVDLEDCFGTTLEDEKLYVFDDMSVANFCDLIQEIIKK